MGTARGAPLAEMGTPQKQVRERSQMLLIWGRRRNGYALAGLFAEMGTQARFEVPVVRGGANLFLRG